MASSLKPSLFFECITLIADFTVKQVSTIANAFLPISLPPKNGVGFRLVHVFTTDFVMQLHRRSRSSKCVRTFSCVHGVVPAAAWSPDLHPPHTAHYTHMHTNTFHLLLVLRKKTLKTHL